jgi:hypothetical protein
MRELTNEGVGVEQKRSDPVSKEDERTMWEKGVFSMDTSKGLSNAVFFYNGKVFGLRGGEEHIGLLAEQFHLGHDDINNRDFVKFVPRLRKNAQGGLKSNKKVAHIREPIVHYESATDCEISVFKLYEKYLSLIPRCGNFYRKPLDDLKFSAGNVPQKELKTMMKSLFQQAGIPIENRNISNHSGRVTLCTTLFNERFSDKTVMNRSKHSSTAVHQYQREQFPLQEEVSKTLEPVLPEEFKKPKIEPIPEPEERAKSSGTTDDTLVIHVPSCVRKVIVVTCENKRQVLEI